MSAKDGTEFGTRLLWDIKLKLTLINLQPRSMSPSNNQASNYIERGQTPAQHLGRLALTGSNHHNAAPSAQFQATTVPAGPELIDDRHGLPLAPGMAEEAMDDASSSVRSGGIVEKVRRFELERRKRWKARRAASSDRRPSVPSGNDDPPVLMPPVQMDIKAGKNISKKPRGQPETIGADDEPSLPEGWSNAKTKMDRKDVFQPSTTDTQRAARSTQQIHVSNRTVSEVAPHTTPQLTSDRPRSLISPPAAPAFPQLTSARPRNATPSPSSIPPTVDDATIVQGGEATPVYVATVVPQEPTVQDDPSSVRTDADTDSQGDRTMHQSHLGGECIGSFSVWDWVR